MTVKEKKKRRKRTFKFGAPFTNSEKKVLNLLFKGKSVKIIAYDLGIAEYTARCYIQHMFKKRGVHSALQLVLAVLKEKGIHVK